MKIAFYDTKPYDKQWFEPLAKEYGYGIEFFEGKLKEQTAVLAKGCDGVCIFVNDVLNKEVADILCENGVKVILLRCAGYDNVDLKGLDGRIPVLRVPGYSPAAVAEHSAGLLLAANRKLHRAYSRTREFNFSIHGLMGFNLRGKTAGVIGTGKIGKYMIEILKGFGMEVLAYDPYPDTQADISYVPLEKIFQVSDVITLHCPLTKDTRYMINKNSISRMKDGVILINTSRGALVDTEALIDGLKSKKFAGVGLDVYEEEDEYFFEDRSNEIINDDTLIKLVAYPNVIVTSHLAFFTTEAMEAIATTTLENLKAFEEGKKLDNQVILS